MIRLSTYDRRAAIRAEGQIRAARRKPTYIYVRLALMRLADDYERTLRADILSKRTTHTTISE